MNDLERIAMSAAERLFDREANKATKTGYHICIPAWIWRKAGWEGMSEIPDNAIISFDEDGPKVVYDPDE